MFKILKFITCFFLISSIHFAQAMQEDRQLMLPPIKTLYHAVEKPTEPTMPSRVANLQSGYISLRDYDLVESQIRSYQRALESHARSIQRWNNEVEYSHNLYAVAALFGHEVARKNTTLVTTMVDLFTPLAKDL